MFSQLKTLKQSLEELIDRHGLAEVLDRLADITHTYNTDQSSQITNHLEQATHQALTIAHSQTPLP